MWREGSVVSSVLVLQSFRCGENDGKGTRRAVPWLLSQGRGAALHAQVCVAVEALVPARTLWAGGCVHVPAPCSSVAWLAKPCSAARESVGSVVRWRSQIMGWPVWQWPLCPDGSSWGAWRVGTPCQDQASRWGIHLVQVCGYGIPTHGPSSPLVWRGTGWSHQCC